MKHSLSMLSRILAVASLCVSAAGFAGITHKPVGVPTCGAQYRVGITGYWARAMNDDLVYASTSLLRDNLSVDHNYQVEHDYEAGFGVNAAMRLNNSGTDVAANYTYFSSDADDTASEPAGGAIFSLGIPAAANTISGSSEFTFHEFNVEVGQLVDFCQLHTRFHFGLSYASIDHDFRFKGNNREVYEDDDEIVYNSDVTASIVESQFAGIGPRVGVDMNYPINNCSRFALVAHATGSILAGYRERFSKSRTQKYDVEDGVVVPTTLGGYDRHTDDSLSVVPAGSIKAGLRYGSVQEPGQAGWAVEAGWHAMGYLHSVSSPRDTSSFSNAGFYLTLDYAG